VIRVPGIVRHPRRIPGAIRAARWAVKAHQSVSTSLQIDGLAVRVFPPPLGLPVSETKIVVLTLRARRATCLERSLVLQEWLRDHGRPHDVVIGVRQDDRTTAHAWVDGVEPSLGFLELHRVPSP
jgi:hypothetical protein